MPMSEFPKSSYFDKFPRGCCGDTSKLFSKFLSSKGIETFYVWGMRNGYSHAWVEYEEIIMI
ncbi:transglutaminase domain-containing protein [Brevibacillus sp. VP]|nr:transglutaminase domain-containing protein [Brevibacillus sp. VP]